MAAKLYILVLTFLSLSLFLPSYVLAAYANFLWETEENEEDSTSQFQMPSHNEGAVADANAQVHHKY